MAFHSHIYISAPEANSMLIDDYVASFLQMQCNHCFSEKYLLAVTSEAQLSRKLLVDRWLLDNFRCLRTYRIEWL